MVPESLKAVAMYYDSANVATPPATTDELLAFVQGGGKAGVLTRAYFGWGWYSAFGGKIFNDDNSCAADDSSGVADALAYVGSLNDAGAIVDSNYANINDPFVAGNLDVIFNGNWALGDYRAARSSLAVAPFVSGPGGQGRTMTGVDGWYINAAVSAEQQELAIAVAKLLVSAESQQIMVDVAGHVPANSSVTSSDALVASFTDAIYSGDPRPQSAAFGQYWGPFDAAWDAVVPDDDTAAGGDPTEAVGLACTTMEAAIAGQ
jgi:maltose-binding protein MalE